MGIIICRSGLIFVFICEENTSLPCLDQLPSASKKKKKMKICRRIFASNLMRSERRDLPSVANGGVP